MTQALYDWWGANLWVFRLVSAVHSDASDAVMRLGTLLGSYWIAPFAAVLIASLAYSENAARLLLLSSPRSRWFAALYLVATFVVALAFAAAAVQLLKEGVALPRPAVMFPEQASPDPLVYDDPFGFPSGHATFAAVAAGSVWHATRSKLSRRVALTYALWVGLSRINLGAHFPVDVAAGYGVGWLALRSSIPTVSMALRAYARIV